MIQPAGPAAAALWRRLQPTDRRYSRRPVSQPGQRQDTRRGCRLGLFQRHCKRQYDLPSGTLRYDAANATVLGRQVSLQVVKGWGR